MCQQLVAGSQIFFLLFCFKKIQRVRIDAIAQSCRRGTVFKHMTEMCIASAAQDFGSLHKKAAVFRGDDAFFRNRRPKAGPAGSRIEFCFRTEQIVSAAHAEICPFFFEIVIFAAESLFGSFFSCNPVLFRTQQLSPFLVALDNFLRHASISCKYTARRHKLRF